MDVSKLPKLSQSPPPPPQGAEPPPTPGQPPAATPVRHDPPRSTAAEIWISVGIGLIVLFLYPNTVKYFAAKATGKTPAIYPDPTQPAPAKCDFILHLDGTKVMYRDTTYFWSDLAITAFGIVLILDGIVPAITRKRGVLNGLMALTLLTVLANLAYLLMTLNQGIAIISALAVVIGGYLLMLQWQRLGYGLPGSSGRA